MVELIKGVGTFCTSFAVCDVFAQWGHKREDDALFFESRMQLSVLAGRRCFGYCLPEF